MDSDEELDRVLSIVQHVGASEKFRPKGHLLLRFARQSKALKGLRMKPAVAPHVEEQIRIYNEDFAKTNRDIINVVERHPTTAKGS
eukprot:6767110-Pyramimonas_sp.AAC.1